MGKHEESDREKEYFELECLAGDIGNVFEENKLEDLRLQLWQCFLCITDGNYPKSKADTKDRKALFGILDILLDAAYSVIHAYEKEGFKMEECRQKVVKGPVAGSEEVADLFARKIALHSGKILYLEYDECLDIYLFFERFFTFETIVHWKRKLKAWKKTVVKHPLFYDNQCDENPSETYLYLLKLTEACYLLNEHGFHSLPNTPLSGYFDNEDKVTACDFDGMFNPFEYLNRLLKNENASTLKRQLKVWFKATRKGHRWKSDNPARLINFKEYFQALIETAFLIRNSVYIFEEWLDPKTWSDEVHAPVKEYEGYLIEKQHLTKKELENPYLVLEKELKGNISFERFTLDEWLWIALDEASERADIFNYHLKFIRLIEALYLINVNICVANQGKAE